MVRVGTVALPGEHHRADSSIVPQVRAGLPGRLRLPRLRHPAQFVVAGFASTIALGTVLLMLPQSHRHGGSIQFTDALFTSTSAVSLTGLTVVDTATYWSTFGQVVILALVQLGGLGIMTFASLIVFLAAGHLGLKARMSAAAETRTFAIGDVRRTTYNILRGTLVIEGVTAFLLATRFFFGHDDTLGRAIWHGVYHAVMAFNNAGFVLWSGNLTEFVGDPFVLLPVAVAAILGGLGFPVIMELRRRFGSPRRWSLHTKIALLASTVFLLGGVVIITALEWTNPHTLGPMSVPEKLLAGFFHGTMPRSAGFNAVEVGLMTEQTWLVTDVLMFVGASSSGTGGGIKVTTFAVLFFALRAELRGDASVTVFGRKLPSDVQRQALTIALLAVAAVVVSTIFFMVFTKHTLGEALFEVTSALGTCGLSTGITPNLYPKEEILLTFLMFVGRIGPVTLGSALALRQRTRMYELPEERPAIG